MRWRILLNVGVGAGLLAGSMVAMASLAPAGASVSAASSAVPLAPGTLMVVKVIITDMREKISVVEDANSRQLVIHIVHRHPCPPSDYGASQISMA